MDGTTKNIISSVSTSFCITIGSNLKQTIEQLTRVDIIFLCQISCVSCSVSQMCLYQNSSLAILYFEGSFFIDKHKKISNVLNRSLHGKAR